MKNSNNLKFSITAISCLFVFVLIGLVTSAGKAKETISFTDSDLSYSSSSSSSNEVLTIDDSDLESTSSDTSTSAKKETPTTNAGSDTVEIEILEQGISAPFLWKIEGPTPSYLFGTIHLPDPRVTNLKPSVQKAFDNADAVYTEIPMGFMDLIRVSSMATLPPGQTLTEILDKRTQDRVNKILNEYELSLSFFNNYKVWYMAAQLGQLDLLKEMMKNPVVLDMKIYSDAAAAGKEVGGLKTAESQIAVFDELSQQEQINYLKDSLDTIEEAMAKNKEPGTQMLDAYLSGDTAHLVELFTEYMDFSDPFSVKLYHRLLTNRDQGMSNKIESMIENNPDKSYFFAVGAAHLPRKDGIVGLLREKGYTVTRVTN